MKKILLALMLVTPLAQAEVYDWKITRVKDGDTVEFEAKWLPPPLKPLLSLRVLGVDTPEKAPRAKCDKEARGGQAATDFTKKKVAEAKKIQIEIKDWDKFGGRVLGDVIIDGQSLSKMLIDNQLARPYHGEAKKSWCE